MEVLKLAYPDPAEKLSLASAGVMLHHLLLLQYMNTLASSAVKAAMQQAYTRAGKNHPEVCSP